jgi:hypothetical protein
MDRIAPTDVGQSATEPRHPSIQDAKLAQLRQLLELKLQGALSEQEFQREKQKILLQ